MKSVISNYEILSYTDARKWPIFIAHNTNKINNLHHLLAFQKYSLSCEM